MRLHEDRELFSDALQAASQPVEDGGLGIKSIFYQKASCATTMCLKEQNPDQKPEPHSP